ncbi:cold shock domain-containing protein [Rhodocytophaga aerolata]|jgi:cold shock protein|uniref:Cold shock domain-containing protein n=1 Tax=Rhodocytophaga aerolata TaxID=455078 RepID=A0ABT8R4K5_9BACT|nr:cold shock domain-containing protein [Rhodocytophaga aerolata]MDO1445570.1 cold shock domain-containing protein [Rhodocytophaga aerolata]
MPQGTVKFFNETKGFGFIVDDETQQDIFVHVSGIQEEIRQNDRVSYKITEDKRGSKAIDVRPL